MLGFGAGTMTSVLPEKACEAQLVNPLATTGASGAGSSSGAFMHVDLQEHLTRVFLCATAGVVTFEEPCDASNSGSECTVRGISCPTRARTNRETCLRLQDEPCARGHIAVGGGPLRSRRAPQWVQLSRSGDGYRAEPASDAVLFGTSWLAEALVVAGRRYHLDYLASNPNADPIRVKQASTREGGWLPDDESHQTGLQLRLVLPSSPSLSADIDWDAARAQVQALEEAGFSHLKLKGKGERATCDWKPALCIGGGAPIGELIARIGPPALSAGDFLPWIRSASLTPIANTTSAQLEVMGHDLGLSFNDILTVAVGVDECTLTSITPPGGLQTLTASCSLSGAVLPGCDRWIQGFPTVKTASGGEGVGSVSVEALLAPTPMAPLPTSTCSLDHANGTFPVEWPPSENTDGKISTVETPVTLEGLDDLLAAMRGGFPECTKTAQCASQANAGAVSMDIISHLPPNQQPRVMLPAMMQLAAVNATFDVQNELPARYIDLATHRLDQACNSSAAQSLYSQCAAVLFETHRPTGNQGLLDLALLGSSQRVSWYEAMPHLTLDADRCSYDDDVSFVAAAQLPTAIGNETALLTVESAGSLVMGTSPLQVANAFGSRVDGILTLGTSLIGDSQRCQEPLASLTTHSFISVWLPTLDVPLLLTKILRASVMPGMPIVAHFDE